MAKQKVVIAGANATIGKSLIALLSINSYAVIALVRKPQIIEGADSIIEDWMNNPQALDALRQADVIVNLTGDLFNTDAGIYAATIPPVVRILSALDKTRKPHLLAIGYCYADANSPNAYLRANGQREQMMINTGLPVTVFRCPAILNTPADPDGTAQAYTAKGGTVRALGDGKTQQRPIYRGDVVNALFKAIVSPKPAMYDLPGAETMTSDALIRLLNGNKAIKVQYIPAFVARLIGRFIPGLTPTIVDIILRPITTTPTAAVNAFGLTLTPVTKIWTPAIP